jgi:hypothetical protein
MFTKNTQITGVSTNNQNNKNNLNDYEKYKSKSEASLSFTSLKAANTSCAAPTCTNLNGNIFNKNTFSTPTSVKFLNKSSTSTHQRLLDYTHINSPVLQFLNKSDCEFDYNLNENIQPDVELSKSSSLILKDNDDSSDTVVKSKNDDPKVNQIVKYQRDGGWGWIVVIAACWCYGLVMSMQNSYSILVKDLTQQYQNNTHTILYISNY